MIVLGCCTHGPSLGVSPTVRSLCSVPGAGLTRVRMGAPQTKRSWQGPLEGAQGATLLPLGTLTVTPACQYLPGPRPCGPWQRVSLWVAQSPAARERGRLSSGTPCALPRHGPGQPPRPPHPQGCLRGKGSRRPRSRRRESRCAGNPGAPGPRG